MTYVKARAKANRLTAAGVPTMVVKNGENGYTTRTVAKVQACRAKYERTAKARARYARYRRTAKRRKVLARYVRSETYARYQKSPARKASDARSKLGKIGGQIRLNRRGERFREADLLELRAELKGNCMVCGKPLAGTLSDGRKDEVVEHGHHDGFVRALTHHRCNTLLSIIED